MALQVVLETPVTEVSTTVLVEVCVSTTVLGTIDVDTLVLFTTSVVVAVIVSV